MMADSTPRDFTPLAVRLAALWLAAGAFFKLFAGTPADLPRSLLDALPREHWGLLLESAVAAELTITFVALLRPRHAWPAVVAVFLLFEVVLVDGLLAGDSSCGCFGASVVFPPWLMMGIDGMLLLAILLSRPWRSRARPIGPVVLAPVAAVLCIVLPFWYIEDELRWYELDITSWSDQFVYDTELSSVLPDLEAMPVDGLYVFYRPDCEHCSHHLQEIAMADDGSRPIVLIRIDEEGQGDPLVQTLPIGGHVIETALMRGPQYLVEAPAEFSLEGGVVRNPREGIGSEEEHP